ncbi:hypothetical protein [Candidatus Ruminimicrobium bovinum]|uniref:hypothetical protein n=1 Tax=Candidatus Ruminimicrobium bovinum TaxID=3242779 RepID=UPI0039B902E1
MKKNIFLIASISFILVFTVLYILITFNYDIRLKTAIENEKQTAASYLTIAANELKNNYLKSDDISLLYSTEYFSKIKNISEVFILDKDSTISMHNDSSKWNKKLFGNIYSNVINSKEQLFQSVNDNITLYSFPVDDNGFICFVLSFEDITNNYSAWKNKLYLCSLIISLIISIIIYLLCYILLLKPFTETKKILTVKDNNKRTIYFELIDMVKQCSVENKKEIKNSNNLPLIIDKLNTKKDIISVLDSKANIIYISNTGNKIFKSSKNNIHIMEATNNSEIIKTVSDLLENKKNEPILLYDLQLKIEPIYDLHNNLTAILITKIVNFI